MSSNAKMIKAISGAMLSTVLPTGAGVAVFGAVAAAPSVASAQVVPPGCTFPPGGQLTCNPPVIVNPNPGTGTGDVTQTVTQTNTQTNTQNVGPVTLTTGPTTLTTGPTTVDSHDVITATGGTGGQGGTGGAGGSGTATAQNGDQIVNMGDTIYRNRVAAAAAHAPTIVANGVCSRSWSVGVQVVQAGVSGGRSTPDAECLRERDNSDFRRRMLDSDNIEVQITGITAQCEYDAAVCRAMEAPESAWASRLRRSSAPAPVIVSSAPYTPAGAPAPAAPAYVGGAYNNEQAGRVPPVVPAPTVQ